MINVQAVTVLKQTINHYYSYNYKELFVTSLIIIVNLYGKLTALFDNTEFHEFLQNFILYGSVLLLLWRFVLTYLQTKSVLNSKIFKSKPKPKEDGNHKR